MKSRFWAFLCLLAFCGCKDRQTEKSLADAQARVVVLEQEASDRQSAISRLQGIIDSVQTSFSNEAGVVAQQRAQISAYESHISEIDARVAEWQFRQKSIETVPATCLFTFPLLVGPTGQPFMTNAEYVRIIGRGLRFKSGIDLEVVDVDDLHPSILARLGIDPEQAKKNETELKEAKARFFSAMGVQNAKSQAEQSAWQEKWNQEQTRIAADQKAKQDAALQNLLSLPPLRLPRSPMQRIGFGPR